MIMTATESASQLQQRLCKNYDRDFNCDCDFMTALCKNFVKTTT